MASLNSHQHSPTWGTILPWVGFFVSMLGSSSIIWHQTNVVGVTFDEPFYMQAGLESWRTGSNHELMSAGTMPLPVDVQTLPIYLWEQFEDQPFHANNQLEILLPVARKMNLLFWWVLLASVFATVRRWTNPASGLFAVLWIAFDPNLQAHAALATTDLAVSAMLMAFTWSLTIKRQDSLQRILVPGVLLGLALSAKASSITFAPIIWLMLNLDQLRQKSKWRDGLLMTVVSFVFVFAYCGSDWATEPSFQKWANSLPSSSGSGLMVWLAEHLRIFPNAGEGFIQQIKHNLRGHDCYILGDWHRRAVWYYFPVLFTMKVPELALVSALLLSLLRPRLWLSVPGRITLALLLFSLNCRVQIGIRLMFPMLMFFYLSIAVGWAKLGLLARGIGWLVVVFVIVDSFAGQLARLRYQNRLWGGAETASQNLTDSNFDWGQAAPELHAWWQSHQEPHWWVWYYGTDPAAFLPPFRQLPVHRFPQIHRSVIEELCRGHYFLVSTTFLNACPDRRPQVLEIVSWLKTIQPKAQVAGYNIYDFRTATSLE